MIPDKRTRYFFIASLIASGCVAAIMILLARASTPEPVVAAKGDFLGQRQIRIIPIPTATQAIPEPPVIPAPVVAAITQPVAPLPPPVKVQYHDICTVHHMHKEYTQNGKSWRCRK